MSASTANNAEFQDGGKPVAQPVYFVNEYGVPTGNMAISQAGYIAILGPTQTSANEDTTFTFAQPVNTVVIQNNTSAVLNYAFDQEASAGSLLLAAGQQLIYSKCVTEVHLFTASATNVNGTSAGNIVLLGEL